MQHIFMKRGITRGDIFKKKLFLETIRPFEIRPGWNLPWIVVNNMHVFCINQKIKMITTAGHS